MFSLGACKSPVRPKATEADAAEAKASQAQDYRPSLLRVNSTQQDWNVWQPWEKNEASTHRALGAIVGDERVLTTADLVADASYIEFESPDGTKLAPAKVIAVDYEANLALLGPADEQAEDIFANTRPFVIAKPMPLGSQLDIVQVEENGTVLTTRTTLQSAEVSAGLLPDQSFLTYRLKGSMQSAASSYSLPVIHDGKFAGVLLSYDSEDQLSDVSATELVARFVEDAASGEFPGFPSLGLAATRTEDPSFRAYLKLADDQGGVYVNHVAKESAAESAGVQEGDVILAVDGQMIDRRGYYQHPVYGNLFWAHLIRGEKRVGDTVKLSIHRDGQPVEVVATLTRPDPTKELVPTHTYDQAPNYLVKGGMVFQELTLPLLQGFGKEWLSRAPLNLLNAYENPEEYEGKVNRVVVLTGVIPTPATIGYESLRNLIVSSVNGTEIKDIATLAEAFERNLGELQSIEFRDENLTIQLDDALSASVDAELLQRGIPKLSRIPRK